MEEVQGMAQNKEGGQSMKRLLFLFVALAIVVSGCNKPPEVTPPAEDGAFVPSNILVKAINTGCTTTKFYMTINSYWGFVRPFLPASITSVAVPAINLFRAGLRSYNDAVIAWYDGKKEPTNFEQLEKDLLALKESIMPIIQEIMALINKDKPDAGAVVATKEMKDTIEEKAMFSCTIDELKEMNTQLKAYQDIT
jgi:hypothetical protein